MYPDLFAWVGRYLEAPFFLKGAFRSGCVPSNKYPPLLARDVGIRPLSALSGKALMLFWQGTLQIMILYVLGGGYTHYCPLSWPSRLHAWIGSDIDFATMVSYSHPWPSGGGDLQEGLITGLMSNLHCRTFLINYFYYNICALFINDIVFCE